MLLASWRSPISVETAFDSRRPSWRRCTSATCPVHDETALTTAGEQGADYRSEVDHRSDLTASSYDLAPKPLILPLQTAAMSERRRISSRAKMLDRWTSTTGRSIAAMASAMASEVWV